MICGGPGCETQLVPRPGPGRPQVFCSEACKRRAERDARRLRKASDLVDQLRTVPTMVAVAALVSLREADLDRVAAIAAWKGKTGLSGITATSGSHRNYSGEIVTPSEDTRR